MKAQIDQRQYFRCRNEGLESDGHDGDKEDEGLKLRININFVPIINTDVYSDIWIVIV